MSPDRAGLLLTRHGASTQQEQKSMFVETTPNLGTMKHIVDGVSRFRCDVFPQQRGESPFPVAVVSQPRRMAAE